MSSFKSDLRSQAPGQEIAGLSMDGTVAGDPDLHGNVGKSCIRSEIIEFSVLDRMRAWQELAKRIRTRALAGRLPDLDTVHLHGIADDMFLGGFAILVLHLSSELWCGVHKIEPQLVSAVRT